MGLLDTLKGVASSVRQRADKALDQHGDKLATGVEKAGGAVNKATLGKLGGPIDRGVDLAKKPLVKGKGGAPSGPGTGGTGPGVPPAEPQVSADPVDSTATNFGGTVDPEPPSVDSTVEPVDTDRPSSPGTGGGAMPGTASPGSAP